jgi:hypothetical protein
MNNIITLIILSFVFVSCDTYRPRTLVIDKRMKISSLHDNLIPRLMRGSIGLSWAFPNSNKKEIDERSYWSHIRIGTYSKSLLISRWGDPDRIEKKNGIEYLIYSKNSRKASHYELQSLDESRPVTLGYSGDRLVYASAYFLRDGKRLVGDVYYCR